MKRLDYILIATMLLSLVVGFVAICCWVGDDGSSLIRG